MKQRMLFFVVFCLSSASLCLSSASYAQTLVTVDADAIAPQGDERARSISIGAGPINYLYEEPGLMKIKGTMTQVNLAARFPIGNSDSRLFTALRLGYAFGSENTYDGALQKFMEDGTVKKTPYSSGSRDSYFDWQGLFGSAVYTGHRAQFELWGGLGGWNLNNKITGLGSYGREASYFYAPLGATYVIGVGRGIKLDVSAEYDLFLSGRVVSRLSDLSSSNSDIEHTQTNGSGARLSAGCDFSMGKMGLFAKLFYHSWSIEESDTVRVRISESRSGSFVEPRNKTEILGLNLGASF